MTATQAQEQKIIKAVCQAFGITHQQLRSKSRKKKLCCARSIAGLHLQRLGYSTPAIGKILNRHHSTVVWSLQMFRNWSKYDPEFKGVADACEAAISGYNRKGACYPCKVTAPARV